MKRIRKIVKEEIQSGTDVIIYPRLRIDLRKILNYFDDIVNELSNIEDNIPDGLYTTLKSYMNRSKSSLMAPAFNLNRYLDNLSAVNIDLINDNKSIDDLVLINIGVDVHAILISIKTLLDRLVAAFSFYYSGLSLHTTFGRIEEGKSARGLMQKVCEMKEIDELMKYIYDQYFFWIKDAVSPRDMVIHYNDLGLRKHHTVDGRIIPVHVEKKIFAMSGDEDELPNDFSYKDLVRLVNNLYDFIGVILSELLKRDIKYRKQHFINQHQYENYQKTTST